MHVAPLVGKQRESVHLATARLNIWEGSVRSSKTISSIIAWIKFVREAPPGNLLMVGKTERTLKRNIIDPMVEMLGPKRCKHIVGSGEVWLLGRRIYTAGANDERAQDKIRGLSLLGAYVDEISTVPSSFWTMLLGRLSMEGARLLGTSNPDSPGHYLKRDFLDRANVWLDHEGLISRRSDGLDLARFSFRLADNPHLPKAYIASLEREYVGLWHKRYIQGLWVAAEGSVYDMWDPDVHVADIIPPIVHWIGAGVDYGTTNPFAALMLGLGANGSLYLTAEYRYDSRQSHRQLTDAEYSQRFRQWMNEVPIPASRRPDGTWLRGVRPDYVVVDPSAASFRVQLHNDGVTNVAADNEVLDGIRVVSSLLASRKLLVHRSCEALIAELPGYAWDDTARLRGEDKPLKVDDHSVDSARYVIKTTRAIWANRINLAA